MKTTILVIILLACFSCGQVLTPERTYVVRHSQGIDTLKARQAYYQEGYIIFYSDVQFGQKVGVFFTPYSFKAID